MTGPLPADALLAAFGGTRKPDPTSVREAGAQFEALVLEVLVRESREAMAGKMFGQGAGSSTLGSWFDQLMAEHVSTASPLGLGDQLAEALERNGVAGGSTPADGAPGESPGEPTEAPSRPEPRRAMGQITAPVPPDPRRTGPAEE